MHGLGRWGSKIKISGQQPNGGLAVPLTAYAMTFDEDATGACWLVGLRFQLDLMNDISSFLGKPLDVKVDVQDSRGVSATATASARIDDHVVCPLGGADCR
jgi:hypothetical protein